MNYRILFFIIGLSIFLMGSVLFFVVGAGAKQAQQEVLSQTDNVGRYTSAVVSGGTFSVVQPEFETYDHSCQVPFLDPIHVNVIMSYREVPRNCDFFVNEKYITSETQLSPDCIGECPFGDFTRSFMIGYHDVRESHIVKVCCNDICIEQDVAAQCKDLRPDGTHSDPR